jgi:hypothetical protein
MEKDPTSERMQYKFDVALSFAGKDRDYVERVADSLKGIGVRVFYDKYEEVELWGKDLYEHLEKVYSEYARYTVMFISEHYEKKLWTNHERKSAQARAFSSNRVYILPARFDDTKIPGIPPTIGYIGLSDYTPEQFAELIAKKIAPIERPGSSTTLSDVPLLRYSRTLEPARGIPAKGIELFDVAGNDIVPRPYRGKPQQVRRSQDSLLSLSIYLKRTPAYVDWTPATNEWWLHIEANMYPAFNLRVQVHVGQRDARELLRILRDGEGGWELRGQNPEHNPWHPGDYFHVARQSEADDHGDVVRDKSAYEYRLVVAAFTSTNAGVSIRARLSKDMASALADYLEGVGFLKDLGSSDEFLVG